MLNKLDLSLPLDPAETRRMLSKTKGSKTEVRVGCAKWGRPDWVGKIYPRGTKASSFLEEYARQFNCIEFNAIFYKLPTRKEVQDWKSKVGKDFRFCPKFTEVITHRKRLKNTQADVDAFLEILHEFGNNLGPVFFMPHPQMGPKHFDTIVEFIDSLPRDLEVFTEFRHPEWFTQPAFKQIFDALEKRGRGSVITDAAGRRDCVHMRLTTPQAFIRFVGNSLHETDYTRIDEWVDRINNWMKQGLETCYFFMHQHEELYSPELSKYLIEQLNKKCGTDIPVPQFVSDVKPGKTASAKSKETAKSVAKKKNGSPVKKTATGKAAVKKTALSKAVKTKKVRGGKTAGTATRTRPKKKAAVKAAGKVTAGKTAGRTKKTAAGRKKR